METKILIGIIAVVLIAGIGIVVAHTTSESENEDERVMSGMQGMVDSEDMKGMMSMMNSMNTDDMNEMHEMMEEMMNDEEFREEMLEHMKDCPMMKRFN